MTIGGSWNKECDRESPTFAQQKSWSRWGFRVSSNDGSGAESGSSSEKLPIQYIDPEEIGRRLSDCIALQWPVPL
jgi:hypothetical protein